MKREKPVDRTSKRQRVERRQHLELSYKMPVIVDAEELIRIVRSGPHTFDSIKPHVETLQKLSAGIAYRENLERERAEFAAAYWTSHDQAYDAIGSVEDPSIRSELWLEFGRQTIKDGRFNKARDALKRSDSGQALFELIQLDRKDTPYYIEKLKAASIDSTDAAVLLGDAYANGYKTYVDVDAALRYYLDAASRGHCGAIVGLARQLEWGTSSLFNNAQPRYDAVLAFELLKVAAQFPDDKARVRLARLYVDGVGVRRNFDEALAVVRTVRKPTFASLDVEMATIEALDPFVDKSCPVGLVERWEGYVDRKSVCLAYLYYHGIGVEKNLEKAAQYTIVAAGAPTYGGETKVLSEGRTVRVYCDIMGDTCLRVEADTLTMVEMEFVLQHAANKCVQKLYLNGLQLESLPDKGWQFFRVVDLRNNKLRSLPPSFARQNYLKTLLLSGNDWDASYEDDVLQLMRALPELREVDVDKGSERFLESVEFLCLQRFRNRDFTEQWLGRK